MGKTKPIQSVVRAMEILEYMVNHNHCRLQEISEALSLNKSTTYTLLSTLEQKGYVERDPQSPRYSLSISCWQLGAISRQNLFPSVKSRWLLEHLADSVQETCSFTFLCGQQYFFIDASVPNRSVTADSRIGEFQSMQKDCAVSRLYRIWEKNPENLPPYLWDIEEDQKGAAALTMPLFSRDHFIGVFVIYGILPRFSQPQFAKAHSIFCQLQEELCSEEQLSLSRFSNLS